MDRLKETLRTLYAWLGRVGLVFLLASGIAMLPIGDWKILFQSVAVVCGIWLFFRYVRWTARQVIWRLRNRLLVTYTFIAVVPLLLVLCMVAISAYVLMSQVTVYLASTELDRRIELLSSTAETLRFMDPARRKLSVDRMFDVYYKEGFQGIEVVVREGDAILVYPKDLSVQPPPKGWGDVSGIAEEGGHLVGWAHRNTSTGDITVTAPLSPEYMSNLLPQLGTFELFWITGDDAPKPSEQGKRKALGKRPLVIEGKLREIREDDRRPVRPATLPPPANRLDLEVAWPRLMPVYKWNKPSDKPEEKALLQIHTRPSLLWNVLFTLKSDELQGLLPFALLAVAVLFLIVELVALVIGVGMTRTITGAVHEIYDGTQRVMAGDFTRRIPVKGKDQLAELGVSFNRMTENLQTLLAVAKEKERMQSELEIAKEVQGQLFPKTQPSARNLSLRAVCHPARMVSGDYFDYDNLQSQHISFVLGDVAGKGISAALLMASLQSSVRSQWAHSMEFAQLPANGACPPISTAKLVSQLNVQLYKNTAPEKYATFFMGLYDPATSTLSYTNAGHLPPLLFRGLEVKRLNIDGTVVGAFPFSEYAESKEILQSGDVLVCYTDGITEPENAYGEMFGEERLIEVVQRNMHKTDDDIVQAIMDTVFQWTGSPELQDDMTVLLARQQ